MLSKILTLDFISPYMGSVLRHALTLFAGVLLQAGYINASQSTTFVEAAVPVAMAFIIYIWSQVASWVNKARQVK